MAKNVAMNIAENFAGKRLTEVPMQPDLDRTRMMHALVWHGKYDVRYDEVPRPKITHPRDALIKVTAASICGSDCHLWSTAVGTLKDGDVLGHEFMGQVIELGSGVTKLSVGDRVVVSFDIACGDCDFCKREEYTGCKNTNPSNLQKEQFGHRTSAIFGYSHTTGGVPGGQAEYVRVPIADVNCLKVPDDMPDETALYLSDVIPTAFFGAENASVGKGDVVGIWGLGPVGLLCAQWCQLRGAKHIVGIDQVPERLNIAKTMLGIETIDFDKVNVLETLAKRFPDGLDCGIECAGSEYAKTWRHKAELALGLEDDTSDILTEIISAVRPFGRISIVGVYMGITNRFPIGAFMEKGQTMKGGQCPVQRYWKTCIEAIEKQDFDPRFVLTTRGKLSDGPTLYKRFYNKEQGILKTFLRPDALANIPPGAETGPFLR
jgi:threonine dehydrogenase-like Zn-dependent dehydrogenase